jgi:hypothetical protein
MDTNLGLLLKLSLAESGDWVSDVVGSKSWVENFLNWLLRISVGEPSTSAKFFLFAC